MCNSNSRAWQRLPAVPTRGHEQAGTGLLGLRQAGVLGLEQAGMMF